MQAACHRKDGTIIADYNPDHGGSSKQTERRTSLGLAHFPFNPALITVLHSYSLSYNNFSFWLLAVQDPNSDVQTCQTNKGKRGRQK